ncbi:MAG: hypothetical protein QOJ38_686 [Solirubrobacterales bacterium]|nr:hypothetical protein [Solirubrobacterales bacterium]
MRRVPTILAGLLLVAALSLPSLALAKGSTAPPGNSGVTEYQETIPSVGGGKPTNQGGGGGGHLSKRAQRALAAQGAAGAGAARLAAATAPEASGGQSSVGASASGSGGSGEPSGGGSGTGALNALGGAASGAGPGGMGIVLPIILASVATLGAAVALRRRRAV